MTQEEEEIRTYYPPITDYIGGRVGCGSIVTLLLLFWLTLAFVAGGCNALSNDPITFDQSDQIVAPGEIAFSGRAEPNEEIVLFVDGLDVDAGMSNDAGAWSINAPLSIPGDYEVTAAYATGNASGTPQTVNITVPTPITIDGDPVIGRRSPEGELVRIPFTWSGTGYPGSTIRLLNQDGNVVAETNVGRDGTWEIDRLIRLNPGENFLIAAMNWDPTNLPLGFSPQVQLSMPQIGGDGRLYSFNFTGIEGGESTLVPLNIRGTAQPGNDVLIFIDNIEVGTARAGDDGSWLFSGFVPAGPRDIRAVVINTLGEPEIESGSVGIEVGRVTDGLEVESSENGFLRILFNDPSRVTVDGTGSGDDDGGDGALDVDISLQGSPAVELIVDASWSMTFPLDSDAEENRLTVDDPDSRIQIAKSAINSFIDNNLPEGSPVAVRAFGNIEGDLSCRTDLMLPLQPVTKESLRQIIDDIEPQFNANTALAASLAASLDDLSGTSREKVIVLLTDGAETCEGDPAAEIERLVAEGVDLRVNIIGFAISDPALKAQFEEWAALGNGQFIDAQDAESLSVALRETLTVVYRVIDNEGSIVASGVVGGLPIELPPGNYSVQLTSAAGSALENVIITPGGLVELTSSVQ